MLKKIKGYFEKKKSLKAQKVELEKMKKYYELLRCGVTFIQYIQNDIKNQKNRMNRHQRKRLEKTLQKGEFTEELINHYKNNLDKTLKDMSEKGIG